MYVMYICDCPPVHPFINLLVHIQSKNVGLFLKPKKSFIAKLFISWIWSFEVVRLLKKFTLTKKEGCLCVSQALTQLHQPWANRPNTDKLKEDHDYKSASLYLILPSFFKGIFGEYVCMHVSTCEWCLLKTNNGKKIIKTMKK